MNTLTPEAIEMLADDYERGMIGPRRLRQYFDYLIQQLAAAKAELAAEIAKKDRMLDTAIDGLIKGLECPCGMDYDCPTCPDCEQEPYQETKCWLAWLEKEAEVQG